MSTQTRLVKLEQKRGINAIKPYIIFLDNMLGCGSEEEQLEKWRRRHPGIEPSNILRVSLVGFSELKP